MWEGLTVWVGVNKRDMVMVAQMMLTIRFGLLQPDFYLRNVEEASIESVIVSF